MPRPAKHRDRLVQTAMRLFRHKGFASTGLAEILARSGAPRGSLYHYFPGGKADIAAEAVRAAGASVSQTLDGLLERTDSGAAFVGAYVDLLARTIEASDYRDGCPIATTLLETTSTSEDIAAAGREAFDQWTDRIARAFGRDGDDEDRARERATLLMAAVEGALLLSRVQRTTEPLRQVARAFA